MLRVICVPVVGSSLMMRVSLFSFGSAVSRGSSGRPASFVSGSWGVLSLDLYVNVCVHFSQGSFSPLSFYRFGL